MSRHRAQPVRPRYGRMTAAGSALAVTLVSVLGGLGMVPAASDEQAGSVGPSASGAPAAAHDADDAAAEGTDGAPGTAEIAAEDTGGGTDHDEASSARAADLALPARSGTGRRVVYSESAQRVWLVGPGDRVRRTYPVSGSVYDNLDPGSYEVYSRSERAWGIDDSGTMRWFVRFAHGPRAAIGFHDIPVKDGEPLQTAVELGTPQSHGCIRQRAADARALWKFAPIGTTVVVVA